MSIVTNRIERLAFNGKCRWQVFWAGLTSTYTIPVPAGGFVLLRQIIYNPYYQGETKADQLLNTVHQLTLSTSCSRSTTLYTGKLAADS